LAIKTYTREPVKLILNPVALRDSSASAMHVRYTEKRSVLMLASPNSSSISFRPILEVRIMWLSGRGLRSRVGQMNATRWVMKIARFGEEDKDEAKTARYRREGAKGYL
jgi:hypothetical protein